MPIKFKAVPRANPFKPDEPLKYYSSPVYTEKVTLRKMAEEIADRTSLSIPDTLAVLEAMTETMPDFLCEGKIVSLGEFGSFRVSLQSKSADSPKAFTTRNITGVKLLFHPGTELSKRLKKIKTTKVSEPAAKKNLK